jgi:predicted lipoprotein with Yx(FWY)xxD motif
MTAKHYLIGPLAVAALAATGCGSSSSNSATKAAAHHSMPMSHAAGPTAAAMAGMAVAHAQITVAASPHYGSVLYDKDHFVLYAFSNDHGSASTCYGACASGHGGWPPLLTKGAPRAVGVNGHMLGTTRRSDGSLQVTYDGHPLYYWSGDTAKTIMCQHVTLHGGVWYVIDPSGQVNRDKGVGTMSMMG